jgi:hypothetical protein
MRHALHDDLARIKAFDRVVHLEIPAIHSLARDYLTVLKKCLHKYKAMGQDYISHQSILSDTILGWRNAPAGVLPK